MRFFQTMLAIACGLILALPCALSQAAAAAQRPSNDVLNFQLQQAYLHAAFYNMAAFGAQVPAADRGGGPEAVGGRKGTYTPALSAWVAELAHISLAHVRTLRAQLGANAEKMPAINVGDAWQVAASAALNVTALEPAFSPYANDIFFLHASYLIEDVSVSSLRGVSWMVHDNVHESLIAGLLGSEAMIAGSVRTRLASRLALRTPWNGRPVFQVVDAIAGLRQRLSMQAAEGDAKDERTDIGILVDENLALPKREMQRGEIASDLAELRAMASSGAAGMAAAPAPQMQMGASDVAEDARLGERENAARARAGFALQIAAVNPDTGLAFSRTPRQTLAVLYGSGDASKPGLFFPEGINGPMKGQ